MRIIGLDVGEKRIGVAVSDETGTIASGLDTVAADEGAGTIRKIKDIITKYNAGKVVIGLPLNMDGTRGRQAEEVSGFAEELKKSVSAEIVAFDERLTTKEAEAVLLQADMSRRKRKRILDKVSAQIMLQAYLNSKK